MNIHGMNVNIPGLNNAILWINGFIRGIIMSIPRLTEPILGISNLIPEITPPSP